MKRFQKNKEDFICDYCHMSVLGTGYTNHCPQCLYSKHVDVHPGDRACSCHGLMRPMTILQEKGHHALLHVCEKCGHEQKNKLAPNDDFDRVLDVMRHYTQGKIRKT